MNTLIHQTIAGEFAEESAQRARRARLAGRRRRRFLRRERRGAPSSSPLPSAGSA